MTEGEDKPLKYPHMFRAAELVLLNKIDLLPHVDFSVERFAGFTRRVNPKARILPLSARSGIGGQAWLDFLRDCRRRASRGLSGSARSIRWRRAGFYGDRLTDGRLAIVPWEPNSQGPPGRRA